MKVINRTRLDNIQESVESDVATLILPFLKKYDKQLKFYLRDGFTKAYVSGSTEMILWGGIKGQSALVLEGKSINEAIEWADKRGAELVTGIDEETRRRIANTIRDGIEDKRGVEGIKRDLLDTFSDMSKERATMIAQTETNDALSQAFLDRSKDMGITGKRVVTVDPCDLCKQNAAVGVIPTNQEFPSGHQRPSFHPNCHCALVPARV